METTKANREEIKLALEMLPKHINDKMTIIKHVKGLVPDVKLSYLSAFLDGYLMTK